MELLVIRKIVLICLWEKIKVDSITQRHQNSFNFFFLEKLRRKRRKARFSHMWSIEREMKNVYR